MEFSLEDYCKNYNDLAVRYYIQYGMAFISAIVYGDATGFIVDLYDPHELSGNDGLSTGILNAKSLEEAKKETEEWIKAGFYDFAWY